MNEATLPPSPNWYLNSILSCSFDGSVAWGARNTIVIAKRDNTSNAVLNYSIVKNAHKEKVTSVAFTPKFAQSPGNLLASTGNDETIKIWNLDTLCTAYVHSLGNEKQALGVDWSRRDPLVLFCITSDGCVLSWNANFDTVSSIPLGKVVPTCLSSCPHDSNLVAVGSKNGLVYVVNFYGKGTVNYKLRGHDTEIVGLSWCPSDENVLNGAKKDLLLASGGRDRSIFVWRAGGDGRCEVEIKLPVNPLTNRQHRSKLNASVGNWITVHWVESKLLLASSAWGELISWDLSIKPKPVCKLVHAGHARGLFSIASEPNIQETAVVDWRKRSSLTIWTVAQDRRVLCCLLEEDVVNIKYNIPTQGGYVYCVAACPLDTSRLAFGVATEMLQLWNLSEAHSSCFDVTTLWQKIKGKVRALSWHPEKENLLAYGTDEGRVGVFDTNGNKLPTLFRQYHRKTVYTLGWGLDAHNKHVLYSCAEGELVCYDLEKSNQEPASIFKNECTEFSWKADFSCLAAGFENGSITFLNRQLKPIGHANVSSERVHCLAWHPESTATDLTFSPLRHYLAVAFDSTAITILDLSNLMNGSVETAENSYNVHEVVTTLNGHSDKVVCLAWSPHFSGHLVSGSYDNTAQVWNVETQELMATYTGHCAPVLCCMWSPLHPDFIVTGSADFSIRVWSVGSQETIVPTKKSAKPSSKKHKKKNQGKSSVKTNEARLQNGSEPVYESAESPSNLRAEQTRKTTAAKESKRKKCERTSYFVKSSKTINDKTLVVQSIVDIVKTAKNSDTVATLERPVSAATSLLGEKEDLMLLLNNEKCSHASEGRHNIVTEMDMWSDNLKENLEAAAKQKRLNDFLVSLAPTLSMKTWKDMCEAYANQLVFEENPQKAVSYLLCVHKIYQAIEVFENARLYKEAYALAKCKLDKDDPVLRNVLANWANYSAETGQFEQAAHTYAKLGDFSKTVKYLARRKDASSLVAAAEVAGLSDDEALSKSLAEQAAVAALIKSEYQLARSVIAKFPHLKHREIHLRTLEELKKSFEGKVKFDSVLSWIEGKSNYGLLQTLKISGDDRHLDSCRNDFVTGDVENEETLWFVIGYEMTMVLTRENLEERLKHIVTGLETISQFEAAPRDTFGNQCNFLMEFLTKLDANSPTSEKSVYRKTQCPTSISLRAYLCAALLNWLVKDVQKEDVNDHSELFVDLIEHFLEDVLNKEAVEHWSMTQKINDLESRLSSTLCITQKEDKNDENEEQKTRTLVEELNVRKTRAKRFIDERVCIPNPIVVYTTANEFCCELSDETVKARFEKTLNEIWTKAIS